MCVLVRHYLNDEPATDMEKLISQYIEAVWLEERQMNVTAGAIAKALSGKG